MTQRPQPGISPTDREHKFTMFADNIPFMHQLFAKADRLTGEVIGAAIEVHRVMGPGLLEGIRQRCLSRELELRRTFLSDRDGQKCRLQRN
ncbi:MAG: GxxExxY protein [Isosphaeraceae bacterium]